MITQADPYTLEWFGATTFRLRACGLTLFLDTWLERPSNIDSYLRIDDVDHADYIFISHAHFDHLPGCDRLAKKTGAIVIANGEAINMLREAGVAEEQLIPVAGGERIPLFARDIWEAARRNEVPTAPGPPGAPILPDPSLAAMDVHAWPSLHCLHADLTDTMDTATVYTGSSQYACTIDITRGMRYGLLRMGDILPAEERNHMKPFIDYISDRKQNVMSAFDGGQMTFSFHMGQRTLMWNSHLGGYQGILEKLEPKPDILIQSVAGRANIDGRPYDGSAAEAVLDICRWLKEPPQIIWCLHDEAPIKPFRVDVTAATKLVENNTRSKVKKLVHGRQYRLFENAEATDLDA
ncbi:hypothetical protein PV08_00021 [Exophiala spinifera]|uniref:Metallo-beta-lactamase domain-containing protein n=1 Tax=Exophiala spinifera TaxID=91928 RepID=A0A0D2C7B6_9EURO|nr:uncharacterized protein PV08_00021 [Exophiala spinifera]KIW19449.1 hypothetical protein PV08_00021 [Exophiala spinifera]